MKQLNELQTKWLEALESGRYTQGKRRLRDFVDDPGFMRRTYSYCCLGVACDVVENVLWKLDDSLMIPTLGGSRLNSERNTRQGFLGEDMLEKLDLAEFEQTALAHINDLDSTTDFKPTIELLREIWTRKGYELPPAKS